MWRCWGIVYVDRQVVVMWRRWGCFGCSQTSGGGAPGAVGGVSGCVEHGTGTHAGQHATGGQRGGRNTPCHGSVTLISLTPFCVN